MTESKRVKRDNLVALFYVSTAVLVMIVSLFERTKIGTSSAILKPLGLLIFVIGMFVFAWAVFYLKGAFLGNVEPVTDRLIKAGPYRFVRHPTYLGTIIAIVGLALGLRSLGGLIGVFWLFTPVAIYRAKLEENALARRFGEEWNDYLKATHFMFPPVY